MRSRYFLIALLFIFSFSFISAVECSSIGEVNYLTNQYCDIGGWANLVLDGGGCLNDYECLTGSCADSICGSAFSAIVEQESFLQDILNFILGIKCIPGEDDCAEDGMLIRTCGGLGTWETHESFPIFILGRCDWTGGDEGYCSESGDSGTGDYYNVGICTDEERGHPDECFDEDILLECVCLENSLDAILYNCTTEGKVCSGGKCVLIGDVDGFCECGTSANLVNNQCDSGYTATCKGPMECSCIASTSCTNECTTSGQKICSGNGYKTCGNYDTDSCLEWGSVVACEAGYECLGEDCVLKEEVSLCNGTFIAGTEECDGSDHCGSNCECDEDYIANVQGICEEDLTDSLCITIGEPGCRGKHFLICGADLIWNDLGKVNGSCDYTTNNPNEFASITNGNYVPSVEEIANFINRIIGLNGVSRLSFELFNQLSDSGVGGVYSPSGVKVFKIFSINVDNNTNAELYFSLDKSDVTSSDEVRLYVWEDDWKEVPTELSDSSILNYTFKSQIPHFSLFIIIEGIVNPDDPNNPNNPNYHGDSCKSDWKCGGWSLETCGTRTCIDVKKCKTVVGKPLQTKDCSDGGYCGDGECDGYEDCGYTNNAPECVSDCGACRIGVCGDGVCDADESSYLCAEDCEAKKPVSKLWIFILIIVVLIVGIIGIIFLIRRRLKKDKQSFTSGPGNVLPSQPRMPPRSPPSSIARGYPSQAYNSGFHS